MEATFESPKDFHRPAYIEVAGTDLAFRRLAIDDATPTGGQIAAVAGFTQEQHVSVLHMLPSGELEDLRPNETVDLNAGGARFVVVEADRSFRMTLDGQRFDWPCRVVSGGLLRKLGAIPADKAIYFERVDEPDKQVQDQDLIDLAATGVESFHSRRATWVLNVQGVRLELHAPTIVVRDAMIQAGFDVDQGWHIFLKIAGQKKQPKELDSVIDLRAPGIEKLRLMPKDVTNGEPPLPVRRDFALLDVDEHFLDQHHAYWETVLDGQRRWLLIHEYPVPLGYVARRVTLALELSPAYPGAQIDMFYASPPLALVSGAGIPNTEARTTISGIEYQRWSRHRGPGSQWRADTDNVVTHLALVESALGKELAA